MGCPHRIELGPVPVDAVTLVTALDRVEELVTARQGGTVFTPNVDHVVLAHDNPRLREAYARASLSLADGMPLIWTSRALGTPLPEKVSGSDFVFPLLERASTRGWIPWTRAGTLTSTALGATSMLLAPVPSGGWRTRPRVSPPRPSSSACGGCWATRGVADGAWSGSTLP